MTSNRSIKSDVCAVEGCNELRLVINRGGRVWRSSLCREHDLARKQEYQNGTFQPPRSSAYPVRQFTPAQVYTLWGEGKEVGAIWYQGARVYGLTRYAERFVAVVAPCDQPVKLPKNARLTTGNN